MIGEMSIYKWRISIYMFMSISHMNPKKFFTYFNYVKQKYCSFEALSLVVVSHLFTYVNGTVIRTQLCC